MAFTFKSLLGRLLGIDPLTGDLLGVGLSGVQAVILRTPLNSYVTLAVSTTLTAEDYAGKTVLMDGEGSARTFTLPAATGTGNRYRFAVRDVNTSNYIVKVANSTDVIQGSIQQVVAAATDLGGFGTAGTSDTITLNGTTTGGVNKGDWFEVTDVLSGFFHVTGLVTTSGTAATPFSATV